MTARAGIPNTDRDIQQYELTAAQTFLAGALVLLDGSQTVAECGADPAAVLGVALHPATSGGAGGDRDFLTDKILVALAGRGNTFLFEGDNDPVAADIGVAYGAVKDGDGIWTVDGTETVATVFTVRDVDLERNLYLVEILDSVAQV